MSGHLDPEAAERLRAMLGAIQQYCADHLDAGDARQISRFIRNYGFKTVQQMEAPQ
jgi:hypothetical protein